MNAATAKSRPRDAILLQMRLTRLVSRAHRDDGDRESRN